MMEKLPVYSFSQRELKRIAEYHQTHPKAKIIIPDEVLNFTQGRILPSEMRTLLKANGYSFKRKTIAHLNMRGGIGKTTASISLATRAAQYGFKTCLVDLDPQASATYSLIGQISEEHLVVADLWQEPSSVTESLVEIDQGLHILPSSLDNSILDDDWDQPSIQKEVIRNLLSELWKNNYDLIIFDAPPSLSPIVISIIAAVDQIVVPVWSDPFSLRGLELIQREVKAISDAFTIKAPKIHVLYSHYDARTGISETIFRQVKKKWPNELLTSRIRSSSEFSKSIHKQQTVFKQSLKSSATIDYDNYVRELLGLPLPSPFTS